MSSTDQAQDWPNLALASGSALSGLALAPDQNGPISPGPEPPTGPAGPKATGPTIGQLRLKNPFILAPMAGLTNFSFRRLCLEYGAGLTVSEMVSAVSLSHHGRNSLKLLTTDRDLEKPFCVQLFGKDPTTLAEATKVAVFEAGADLVDLNMACPARKVLSSGHGGALLKNPELALRIVEAMAKATSAPVTVKLRPGLQKADGPVVLELAPKLVSAGAAALILHGRYVSEGFGGQADWHLVTELAQRVKVPVIGSGDLISAQLALTRLNTSGAQGVMIGRAARGRPYIFRECLALWQTGSEAPKATLEERLKLAIRHARYLEEEVGPKACFRLRTILMWYTKDLPGAAALRSAICSEEKIDRQLELLTQAVGKAQLGPDLAAFGANGQSKPTELVLDQDDPAREG